jgi:hypothetical protein
LAPTNFREPWYHDKGLQVAKEIKTLLVIRKRFLGLVIAGIRAAITTIATMTTTAAVALSQDIQNVILNNFNLIILITITQNVSYAFQQQVVIDENIDTCLNL